MGKRGPRPKPTAIKKLEGTYRKDRAPAAEMDPHKGIPARPAYLSKLAAAEWDRVVPQLAELGVLTLVDGGVLEGYCSNYGIAVAMQLKADKTPIVKTPFGPKTNPAVGEARKAWALARQYAAELGLSPAARTRVSAPPKPTEEDKTEAFLFGPPRLVVNDGAK